MGTFASCMITRLATSLEGAHDQRPLSPGAPVGCNGDAQPHGRGVRLRCEKTSSAHCEASAALTALLSQPPSVRQAGRLWG
eukprot:scaffold20580_cov78-Phaeocystis_antarctica.AAC.2